MSIVCDTGFINIVDPFLNPDSTVWTGSITYTLQYATTVAGATLVEARQVINVSDGIDICLAPGLYTVVYNQSGQRLPVTSQWTVPPTGGPYTIADLEGVGPVTGSLTVTGPFIAMSTVTMTSLINAAARPYVATDSVGLLSTGNLALIAISGSASDLASGTVAAARGGAGTLSGLLKANGAGVVSAAVAGTDYAVATNGTNAQFLTSNGAGGFGTAVSSTGSGSVVLATSPTLTTPDLGTPSVLVLTNATGLPAAAMPGLTGDVTSSAGSVATTVVKINGTTLSGLATGILKNTTATGVPSIAVAGTDYSVATNGTIGQALTSNGTGGFSTALTLATVATSGSASDLGSGTLSAARLPALTGDATSSVGSAATTVVKINGIALSGLATGLLKNTTTTGVPSIAVAGTDYSVATNGTIGQALTSNGTGGFSTALTLATVATSGSASDLTAGTLAAARGGAGTLSGILKANGAGVVSAAAAGTDYAVATNGTLGQVLTSNAAGGFSTALTLATVATSGSATDLSSGTLPAARMPALTGDVTTTVGTVATTVSKINGTTLSGLATGLLKNTTATGVPSIAVAGTDLIGGVGNLTTVGAVPYVSASGILNQDAGQFFWDATNNRLGIGTATPGVTLDIIAAAGEIRMRNDATNTLALGNWDGTQHSIKSINLGIALTPLSFQASRFTFDTGNVGIGVGTPGNKLTVFGSGAAIKITGANDTSAAYFQFNSSASTGLGYAGVEGSTPGSTLTGTLAYATFLSAGSSGSALQLGTPGGIRATILSSGNVGIGTTAPVYLLDVAKSGASGTARFYDQTATTGATRVVISLGAADTSSTQVFEIGGLMKFSGLNSTGAGTALLGTNSPAVTNTAPYTWFKVLTSDGSTGYIPVWK